MESVFILSKKDIFEAVLQAQCKKVRIQQLQWFSCLWSFWLHRYDPGLMLSMWRDRATRERHGGCSAVWRHGTVLILIPITLTVVMLFWCYRLNTNCVDLRWDVMTEGLWRGSDLRRADCAGPGQWASERRVRLISGHDNKWQGGLGLGSKQSSAVQ